MFKIDSANSIAVMPTPAAAGTPGFFQDGNAGTGSQGTVVSADFLNMLQGELGAFLAVAGITASKTNQGQVLASAHALYGNGGVLNSTSNYQRLAGGLIVQFGTASTVTGNGDTVTFPLTFPNAVRSITIVEANAVGWSGGGNPSIYGWSNGTASNFKIHCSKWSGSAWVATGTAGFSWTALGH